MQVLEHRIENEKMVFVEDFQELKGIKNLSLKKLCIIKTDFKDINYIKKFCKNHSNINVWIASSEISRKNILSANSCGVKNVVQYPISMKLINDFLKDEKGSNEKTKYQSSNQFHLRGLNVMIVDDNQMNIDLLTETLEPFDLKIHSFTKPIEASRIVEHEKFDLFLLDVMMPEMSGFDLAKMIKTSKLNHNTPMMFISALSDPDNKIRGYNLGSCAFIEKPFNLNIVRSQIYSTLKTKRLQDAMQDKKETFLAMVTHDLKTPISAEITALELLLKNQCENLDELQAEIIKDVLGAAKYMKNLVNNILNKYKFDTDTLILNKQNVSIKNVLSDCVEEIKYLVEDKKQKINLKCDFTNANADVDCIEIKRVIHNLLINAIEHGRKNTTIKIELIENKNEFEISIKNKGVGIDLQDPNEIFEKFVSLANKNKQVNSGLGLFISKKIIEMHGGTIKVKSKLNDYTKMTFTIPK
ncbi:MAG: hybrid sensor histidine kinase/response regulator [Candidatus Gastranaerophilales bacterium]